MTDLATQVAKANRGGLTYLEAQVSEIARKTESISKAIDDIYPTCSRTHPSGKIWISANDIQLYSYQYNLKIVGVSQTDPEEKASNTVDLCLKVFSGIAADTVLSEPLGCS